MKEYLVVALLAVSGFGQNVPSVPKSASIPNDPKSPSVPNDFKRASVPNDLKSASIPNDPKSASIPNDPKIPSVPNDPKSASVLSIPSSPSIPPVPSSPPASGVPKSPVVPSLPNGKVPNVPSVPNIAPAAIIPGSVPNVPGADKVANVPLVNGLQNKIERPCQPYDIRCIRQYFLKNARCKPAKGSVPDPLYRALSNDFYSRVNITQTNVNIRSKGLNNARIEEFYINKDTDKLVIGILFQGLSLSTNDSFFRYHRKGKEPIITHGYAIVTFDSLYVTAIIPQVEKLQLDKADVFAFSNELTPKIEFDPKLAESSDPVVQKMFAEFLLNVPVNVAEFLLTEGAYYAAAYIQYVICDFGLELV